MIEILENGIWKQTGWESFEQMKEYTSNVQETWLNNEYNYAVVKFNVADEVNFELYRQKTKKCKCECKSCCRPEKTIFIFGQTKEQAKEYIRTNVKVITEGQRLRGYSRGQGILVILPQGKEQAETEAKARDFEIIEA